LFISAAMPITAFDPKQKSDLRPLSITGRSTTVSCGLIRHPQCRAEALLMRHRSQARAPERGDRLLAAGLGQGALHRRRLLELGALPSRRHPGATGKQEHEPGRLAPERLCWRRLYRNGGELNASRSDYSITGTVYANAPIFPLFPLKFAWHMTQFSETTGMPVATRR
jgi:hypothetical protein